MTVLECVAVESRPKKGRPPRAEPGALVRMSEEVIGRARALGVARRPNVSAGQIIEDLVRGPLAAAWDDYVRGLTAGQGAPDRKKGGSEAEPAPRPKGARTTIRGVDRELLRLKARDLQASGMNQRNIAAILEISVGSVNKLLRGRGGPDPDRDDPAGPGETGGGA